jgi:hypothetical protein
MAVVSLQDSEGEDSTVTAVRTRAGSSQCGGRSGQRGGASQRGVKKVRHRGSGDRGQQVNQTVQCHTR